MKNPFQLAVIILIFVCSLVLTTLVLERSGSFINYVFLYGVSGRFSLNKELSLLAACIGVAGFFLAFALHRSTLQGFTARKHLTVVSMYMNGIALIMLLLMAAFPTVHFS